MAASVPRRPAIPVSSTTDMLVMATLINPGTPTLRISANSDHSRGTPRNARVMSERDERRYVISTRLPAPNDRVRPQPAPAGPNAGTGPQPKISRGERRMCASTLLPITAEGRVMLPVPAKQIQHADRYRAAERYVCVGKRSRQYLAFPAHPPKDIGRAEQKCGRKQSCERQCQ